MIKRLGSVGFVVALLLVACGTTQNSGSQSKIVIGVPEPMTGSLASLGIPTANAAKLSAMDFNKKGGRQVQIVVEDDQCDAQLGVQAAEKLLTEHIIGIAGGMCSGSSIPESDVLRTHGDLPYIAPGASNPKLTEQGYDNVFRMNVRDDKEGPIDASYMYDLLGARRIAIMGDNSTYSNGLSGLTKTALQSHSDAQVVYFDTIVPGQSDYRSALTKVASTNPDVLYFSGYTPELALLIKQRKSLGLNFKIVAGAGAFDNSLLQLAGAAGDDPNVSISTPPLGTFVQGIDAVLAEYKAAFPGADPGVYLAYEYDAVQILANAVVTANSTKAADINKALHNMAPYSGLSGTVQFDSKGDRGSFPFIALTISNGQFVVAARYTNNTWAKS